MLSTTTTKDDTTFAGFRDGYGGDICKRLGIDISQLESWGDYTYAMVDFNNEDFGLVEAAKKFNRVASTGERAVLHAVLASADFAAVADQLAGKGAWNRIDRLGDRARAAVAAAILRRD
jgi:hypothetical protein